MFLNRNVPYEARLFKMKLATTENCEKCNIKETITHLYWKCPNSARLWERLKNIIESQLHSHLPLNQEICMLGTGPWISKSKKESIWFLITLTKHYIHLCKCNGTDRNEVALENYIKSQLRLERILARKKGTINKFTAKWGDMIDWTED